MKILEEFEGILEKIDGDTAYVTLKAPDGEILWGEYPAEEMQKLGIRERRRFKCRTVDYGEFVKIEMEPVPDKVLTEERMREIRQMTSEALLGGDPQSDY